MLAIVTPLRPDAAGAVLSVVGGAMDVGRAALVVGTLDGVGGGSILPSLALSGAQKGVGVDLEQRRQSGVWQHKSRGHVEQAA